MFSKWSGLFVCTCQAGCTLTPYFSLLLGLTLFSDVLQGHVGHRQPCWWVWPEHMLLLGLALQSGHRLYLCAFLLGSPLPIFALTPQPWKHLIVSGTWSGASVVLPQPDDAKVIFLKSGRRPLCCKRWLSLCCLSSPWLWGFVAFQPFAYLTCFLIFYHHFLKWGSLIF